MCDRARARRRAIGWCIALPLALARADAPSEAEALLEAADAPRRVVEEGVIRLVATLERKGERRVESTIDLSVRGDDLLVEFREGWQAGRRILSVGQRGWLFVPGSKRAVPIAARERALTGASFLDAARLRLAEQYDATIRPTVETIAGTECRVLDLVAAAPNVPYPRGVLWVGVGDGLARKLRLSLPSGKDAREILFVAYRKEGARTVLEEMTMLDLLDRRETRTTIRFTSYEPRRLDPALLEPPAVRR